MQIEVVNEVYTDLKSVRVVLTREDLIKLTSGQYLSQVYSPAAFGLPYATRFMVGYNGLGGVADGDED